MLCIFSECLSQASRNGGYCSVSGVCEWYCPWWNTPTVLSVVDFLQGKPLPWQEPWTFPGLYRTSGSSPPLSCTTPQSAPRWTTWAVCTIPCGPLWESVGALPGKPGPRLHREQLSQFYRIDLKGQTKAKERLLLLWLKYNFGLKNRFLVYFLCMKFSTYSWKIVLGKSQVKEWCWEEIHKGGFLPSPPP